MVFFEKLRREAETKQNDRLMHPLGYPVRYRHFVQLVQVANNTQQLSW